MSGKAAAWVGAGAGVALAFAGVGADAQRLVPPAGYSGTATSPDVATPPEAGAPALTRIPDAMLSDLFRVDPTYRRAAAAKAKVVGAFTIAEPAGTHLIAAGSPGFLPMFLAFSDGRCFVLAADYEGGTLSNGRLRRAGCDSRRGSDEMPPPPPSGRALRRIGSAWGYGAWADDRAGTTVITAPYAKTFAPLFTARMTVSAIMAMNSPDSPSGNVTLVGRIDGRLTIVTLEVGY